MSKDAPDDFSYEQFLSEVVKPPFFGEIPEPFNFYDEEVFKKMHDRIGTHHSSLYFLNYVKLTEDLMAILYPNIKKITGGNSLTKEETEKYRETNTIFFKSMFYRDIQDVSVSLERKLEACYYFYKLLDTIKRIYGLDMVDGQDEFLKSIKEHETEISKSKEIQDAHIAALEKERSASDSLENWRFTIDQLAELSFQLYQAKFIDSAENFQQVFRKDLQGICNWKKTIVSFMFLLDLIYKETENYKLLELCDYFSSRIAFHNETKGSRTLRESLRNIESKTKDDPKFLSADYAKLYKIYTSIFALN